MKYLSKVGLEINSQKVKDKIINFFQLNMEERKDSFNGLLISFSGYIDSTVIAKLAIEAIGKENVSLIVNSSNFSKTDKDDIDRCTYERSIEFLEIEEENITLLNLNSAVKTLKENTDLSSVIKGLPLLNYNLGYSMLHKILHKEIEEKVYRHALKLSEGGTEKNKLINRLIIHNHFQNRLKMTLAYLKAETENKFLVGSLNRTEYSLGLFSKHGNSSVDFMPLRNLFRSQIIQLAAHMNIPEDICNLSKPMFGIPGVSDKYHFFFDLPVQDVDLVIIRLEKGNSVTTISDELEIPISNVERINHYYFSTQYVRAGSLAPKI